MTAIRSLALFLPVAGCASSSPEPITPTTMSAADHDAAARSEERAAAAQEEAAARLRAREATGLRCYDAPAVTLDPSSGAERLPVLRPCWTGHVSPALERRREAAVSRRAAAWHRAQAAALWRAEQRACAGLGEEERSHSPFFHREDIASVERIERGRVVGARVRFRKVRGLDGSWMRRAIGCHQARAAALGYASPAMAYCPLMVGPTSTTVEETPDGIVVAIEAVRPDDAPAMLGRALDLAGRAR